MQNSILGSLGEPQKSDYDMFLHCHCNGEDMGSTQARIKSIQFPSIRYFALFNGNCITSKQDRSALCAPALTCLKPYNLGEIVARRLHRNAGSGHLYGGIYAYRVAAKLGISPRLNDLILPGKYLYFEAMQCHNFIKDRSQNYDYNLIFDKHHVISVILPALALFDFQSKQRNYV